MSTSDPSRSDAAALASMAPVPAERDMPPGLQQALLEYLANEVSEPASQGARSRRWLPGRSLRRMRLARPAVMAGMVATAAVAAVAIVLINVPTSRSPIARPTQGACAAPYGNGRVPFPDGYRTTLARAQSAAGFPIPVPHSSLTGRTVPEIWVGQGSPLVALVYGREKLKILLERWPISKNQSMHKPEEWFRYQRGIMARNSATLGRVNGEPALIVRPHSDYCHSNPALVTFYRHGLEINVSSPDYGTTELLKIAQSIH